MTWLSDDALARARGLFAPDPADAEGAALATTANQNPDTCGAAKTEEPALAAGTTLGRYSVREVIGAGGMGVVYAGYDPPLGRRVALKVLRRVGGAGAADGQRRLLREAQALARLSHPNVVVVYDVGSFEGSVFLAMELVDGETLRAWAARGPRSWRETVKVFIEIGRGVRAAHEVGLVHRDLKPENVLVDSTGRVRVTDFGLARVFESGETGAGVGADDAGEGLWVEGVTKSGFVVGTPAYMAPEQLTAGAVDPRGDQFSFCVALYELLYGAKPFRASSRAEYLLDVMSGPPRRPPDSRVPAWLHRLLVKGLAEEPADRFASLGELVALLERGPRRSPGWPAFVAMTCGVAALAAFGLLGPHRRPDVSRIASNETAPFATSPAPGLVSASEPVAAPTATTSAPPAPLSSSPAAVTPAPRAAARRGRAPTSHFASALTPEQKVLLATESRK